MAPPAPQGSAADTRAPGEQREVEAWREAQRGEPPYVQERKPAASFVVESLKDAFIAGLITAALGLFFLGWTTDGPSGPLAVHSRWPVLLTAVAIVFAARLVLNVLFFKNPNPVQIGLGKVAPRPEAISLVGKALGIFLLLIALVLPFLLLQFFPGHGRQYMDLAILILTYVMLGWGLNIVVGLAGLLDLGYVAFYAVGAYSFALLATIYLPAWFGDGIVPWAFFITLPIAGILAALWGVFLGFPVL